jgi:N-acetyl-gamma-glutamyl-phosphate reductase
MFKFQLLLTLFVSIDAFAPSVNHPNQHRLWHVLEMTKKVFIDGEAGTTGLQVRERLSGRDDLEIISPPSELRKDEATRKKFINEADAVILCEYSLFSFSMFDTTFSI